MVRRIIPKILNLKDLLIVKIVLCKTSPNSGLEQVMIVFVTASTYYFATDHEASFVKRTFY